MKIKTNHIILAVAALSLFSCSQPKNDPVERKIDELLLKMTLDEKIGQLNQVNGVGSVSPDMVAQVRSGMIGSIINEVDLATVNELQRVAVEESRLGIPLVYGRDVIHGFKTLFPIPLGQAATWNPSLVERGARIAAIESSSCGVRWTFSPMIDVSRDARWGRIAESFGEDTYLSTVLGESMTRGYQTSDLSQPTAIAACAKHFCGYGVSESGRDYNTTWIPEVQLRDTYLPPFHRQAEIGAATFMCSFNDINGVPSSGNERLNIDILRNEWGYDGLLVSDWSSIGQMVSHGVAEDLGQAAEMALHSQVGMDMMSFAYVANAKRLVEEGKVSIGEIDNSVRDVLRLKFRLGLFDQPYTVVKSDSTYCDKFLADAREACVQSTILLKNDGLLPLADNLSVALIGPMADRGVDQIGTWSLDGEPEHCVTPVMAFKRDAPSRVRAAEPGLKFSRDRDDSDFNRALSAAAKADVTIFFAGEEAILSGEAKCRADVTLPGRQTELLESLKKVGRKVVLVVMAGRPLALSREVELADAVLYQFHGGTMAGPALADIILGKASPSGRLPVSLPRMSGQVPLYYNHKSTGRPAENIVMMDDIVPGAPQFSLGATSYHLDAGSGPLFPFGFGLSYGSFDYGLPVLSASAMSAADTLVVTCDVKNTSGVDAMETPQLYVRDIVGSLCRPVRELKGFSKVLIPAGSSVSVSFKLTAEDLAFCHLDNKTYAEPGDFELWVAPNAESGQSVRFSLVK